MYYNNKQVENTYLVFNISFEQCKGVDEKSNWFKKYNDALNNLDKIQLTQDHSEISKIYSDSKTTWIEGNALIDADATYINKERVQIKNAAIASIQEKYKSLTIPAQSISLLNATDILKGLTGSASFHTVELALPETGSFLNASFAIDPKKPFDNSLYACIESDKNIDEMLTKDKIAYVDCLKEHNLTFKLGEK